MNLTKKADQRVISIKDFSSCSYCSVRRLCLPVSVDKEEINIIDDLITDRPMMKKGITCFMPAINFIHFLLLSQVQSKPMAVHEMAESRLPDFILPVS